MGARSGNGALFVVVSGGLDPHRMSTDQVVAALRGTFQRDGYSPPMLPRVAMEILRVSQAPVTLDYARSVEPLLTEDPVLTAQILRAANSPAMGARSPIRSIRQALTRLGLRGIRDAVLSVSLRSRVFRTPAYQGELDALFGHSQAMGLIAQEVSREVGGEVRFSYLCGLLADLGIAASLLVFGELPEGAPSLSRLWPAMLQVHEQAAQVVGQSWGLPEEVIDVMSTHHHIDGGVNDEMVATLIAAEEIALRLGVHLGSFNPAWTPLLSPERFQEARARIGMSEEQREELVDLCAGLVSTPKSAA